MTYLGSYNHELDYNNNQVLITERLCQGGNLCIIIIKEKYNMQQWLISKMLLTSNGESLHGDGILNQIELKSKKLKYKIWAVREICIKFSLWIVSGTFLRDRSIPTMMNFYCPLSSGQPRLAICSGVSMQCAHFHGFVNYRVCLSNHLLNWEDFFCLCVRFLSEQIQRFQNLQIINYIS